ncbi:MAG: AI-2E family transporter [Patescibacteria group bacterium]
MEGPFTHTKITISAATVAKIIIVLLLFGLAFYLRDVVLIIIASVVIASSIEPIIKWFIGRRIPRTIAVLIIYVCIAVIFAGIFYFLMVPLFGELQAFTSSLPEYLGSLSTLSVGRNATGFGSSVTGLFSNLPITEITARINGLVSALSQNAFTTASVVLGGLLSFVLIIVLSFYLSVQAGGITSFLKTISPSLRRKYIVELWGRAEQKIGLWLQGQLLLGVIIGVLTYLGLTLLGVKHALLLAFIAGVFELIPLFGPILAAIPAVVLSFMSGGFGSSLLVAGFYLIIQQFENQLIYPLVVKKVVGVPPIISIVALVIGAKLAGFLGLLLAVPVAAILMEFFHDMERDRFADEEKSKKSA